MGISAQQKLRNDYFRYGWDAWYLGEAGGELGKQWPRKKCVNLNFETQYFFRSVVIVVGVLPLYRGIQTRKIGI